MKPIKKKQPKDGRITIRLPQEVVDECVRRELDVAEICRQALAEAIRKDK